MGRHTRAQEAKLTNLKKGTSATVVEIQDAVRYCLAAISEGVSERIAFRLFCRVGIRPPTKYQFYRALRIINPVIDRLARDSCEKWTTKLTKGSNLSGDAAWGSRRNSSNCSCVLIGDCQGEAKVVDYKTVQRRKQNEEPDPKFLNVPSNMLEYFGMQDMMSKWRGNHDIVGLVKDGDIKTQTLLHEGWDEDILEFWDPNHRKDEILKVFQRNNLDKILYGLQDKTLGYFSMIIHMSLTPEEKARKWLDALSYMFEQEKCGYLKEGHKPKSKNEKQKCTADECQARYKKFLEESLWIVDKCSYGSTQNCESFNSLKERTVPKNKNWGSNWPSRISLCVLKWNEYDWWEQIEHALNLDPIDEWCEKELKKSVEERKRRHAKQITEEFRHHANYVAKMRRCFNKESTDERAHKYRSDATKKELQQMLTVKTRNEAEFSRTVVPRRLGSVPNIGNTCYLSSVIQMLSRTTFYEDYQGQNLKIDINGTPLGVLMRMFICLDRNMDVNEILPTTLQYLMPAFLDSQQHDVIDFFLSLLNEIEKVICLFGHCIEDMHFYQHMLTRINKDIECEICHKKVCQRCQDPVLILSIPDEECTLEDVFEVNFREEIVDHECESCGKVTPSCVRDTVISHPINLIISFSRFTNDLQKNETVIVFPDNFKFGNAEYILSCVIYHIGGSINSGHYLVRAREKKW